ncbi:MAG: repeat-containing protein [Verrucomicrobiales bacterium]|nr:repeat-containing protein [Verrucomicrobiales bacterium]
MKQLRHILHAAICVVAVLLATSCATKAPVKNNDFVFFPPPPDEPRIQFLTSFSSESDLAGHSKFNELIVGAERVNRPIWKPYGITSTKGKIYVCDTQPKNVGIVDLVKRKMSYLKPEGRGTLKMPINVAVDKDGTRYVTDTVRGQVLIYDAENRFVSDLGKAGEMKPCGIVLSENRLYVSDLSNHCVRTYAKANHELLFTIPRNTNDHKAKLFSPTNLALDEKGNLYVSDSGGFGIQVFDSEGNHLRSVGEVGLKPGRFALPKGIGVDHESRLYVVDAATSVVQMFDAEGKLLMYFGEPQSSGRAGLYLPAGLAVDYENIGLFEKYAAPGYKVEFLIYVTNQAGSQRVSVFGFMRKG